MLQRWASGRNWWRENYRKPISVQRREIFGTLHTQPLFLCDICRCSVYVLSLSISSLTSLFSAFFFYFFSSSSSSYFSLSLLYSSSFSFPYFSYIFYLLSPGNFLLLAYMCLGLFFPTRYPGQDSHCFTMSTSQPEARPVPQENFLPFFSPSFLSLAVT